MATLKEDIASGRVDMTAPSNGKVGVDSLFKAANAIPFIPKMIDTVTGLEVVPQAVIRTPENQAKLDAKYGSVMQDMIKPIGDPVAPVSIQVGTVRSFGEANLLRTTTAKREINGVAIDQAIPIPDLKTRYSAVMESLEVGESFEIPEEVTKQQLAYWAKGVSKGNGKKFIWSKNTASFRVWRTV
jgi:hypothetical protein